jgi:formylglycine-generating enzyme required for sulfatase activity
MKKWVIIVTLFFLMQAVNAEIFNIKGKIVKEGTSEGIAGARVSLKKYFRPWVAVDTIKLDTIITHGTIAKDTTIIKGTKDHYHAVACLSDESGNFHLSYNTPVTVSPLPNSNRGIVIRSLRNGSGILVRNANATAAMRIDLFQIDGRRIASRHIMGPHSRDCFMPLPHSISAFYLIRVFTNEKSKIFKAVPGMGISSSLGSENRRDELASSSMGKKSALISDSLFVTKEGYETVLQAIQSYDLSNISVSMKPSQMWIPSGALEHQGGMVKILAKGHNFEMGQPCDTVRGIFWSMVTTDAEQPVHTVSFTHDFWMDTTEVTQGEYDSLMKITYADPKKKYSGCTWSASNGMGRTVATYAVLWGDAALFCNARSKALGLPDTAYSYDSIKGQLGSLCTLKNVSIKMNADAFRLPTEAEWEYACRGGTTTDFYWGKNVGDYTADFNTEIDNYVVWYYNSAGLGRDTSGYGAHPVAKKIPNKYGLYDMLGNVSEWCNDVMDYYPFGPATDPTGPAQSAGRDHALRGGNWGSSITYIRSSERMLDMTDYVYFFMGFRVIKQINE